MDLSTQRLMMGAAGSAAPAYVEDVFSTWLYTGNGSTQTITNGIDLSGKGGMVWFKSRNNAYDHVLCDTARGAGKALFPNLTSAQATDSDLPTYNSDGFTLKPYAITNGSGATFASWTFRKAAKFFDVVTYTGDDVVGRTVSHNLGSAPGCMIIKRTDTTGGWIVYHRSLGAGSIILLNSTSASSALGTDYWNNTAPTSTVFTLGGGGAAPAVNASGGTYVAYLFAHDAGGFGDSGNDSVVKCGSYTGNGSTSGPQVDLGWEPQWVMIKRTSGVAAWYMYDNMRGVATGGIDAWLQANASSAESASFDYLDFNATGFKLTTSSNDHNGNGDTYIYIAIRRGPMKTPTDATKVFSAITATASTGTSRTIGFPSDLIWARRRNAVNGPQAVDRLRGLATSSSSTTQPTFDMAVNTNAESTGGSATVYDVWNDTAKDGSYFNGLSTIWHHFRRAPGFFDVVAYTGDGDTSTTTVPHGLTVQPELMIIKGRSSVTGWDTYVPSNATNYYLVRLNNTGAQLVGNILRTNASSSTLLKVGWLSGNVNGINDVGVSYIAYLFATCPGVSKVGSYTGTGTTLQVNCGFTSGARFVLIKRTDSTGDWYVWDSARGIVAGNDPYLLLNSTAAEVTSTDYVDTFSSGFEITSTAPAAINANGGSFIFLAVS